MVSDPEALEATSHLTSIKTFDRVHREIWKLWLQVYIKQSIKCDTLPFMEAAYSDPIKKIFWISITKIRKPLSSIYYERIYKKPYISHFFSTIQKFLSPFLLYRINRHIWKLHTIANSWKPKNRSIFYK